MAGVLGTALAVTPSLSAREIDKGYEGQVECIQSSFSSIPQTDEKDLLEKYNNENRPGRFEKVQVCTPPQADIVLAPTTIPTLAQVTAWFQGTLAAAVTTIQQIIIDNFAQAFLAPLNALLGFFMIDANEAAVMEENVFDTFYATGDMMKVDASVNQSLKNRADLFELEQERRFIDKGELRDICEISTEKTGYRATFRNADTVAQRMTARINGIFTGTMNDFRAIADTIRDGRYQSHGSRFAGLGFFRDNPNFTPIQVDDVVRTEEGEFGTDGIDPEDPIQELRNLQGQYRFYCNPEDHDGGAGESGICPESGASYSFTRITEDGPETININKPASEFIDNDAIFGASLVANDRLTFNDEVDYTFNGEDADLEEMAAIDFIRNVFDRPMLNVTKERLEQLDTDTIDYITQKRSLAAYRSVPLTTFAVLYGMREQSNVTGGGETLKTYFETKVFPEGVGDAAQRQEALDGIYQVLGIKEDPSEASPSKEAVLTAMSTIKFLNPSYYAELGQLPPEHYDQRLLDANATETVLIYELLEAQLRREAIMATLLEITLSDQAQKVSDFGDNVETY